MKLSNYSYIVDKKRKNILIYYKDQFLIDEIEFDIDCLFMRTPLIGKTYKEILSETNIIYLYNYKDKNKIINIRQYITKDLRVL